MHEQTNKQTNKKLLYGVSTAVESASSCTRHRKDDSTRVVEGLLVTVDAAQVG